MDRQVVKDKVKAAVEHAYATHRVQQRILFDAFNALVDEIANEFEREKPQEVKKVKA
jgi:hypothetical protein